MIKRSPSALLWCQSAGAGASRRVAERAAVLGRRRYACTGLLFPGRRGLGHPRRFVTVGSRDLIRRAVLHVHRRLRGWVGDKEGDDGGVEGGEAGSGDEA